MLGLLPSHKKDVGCIGCITSGWRWLERLAQEVTTVRAVAQAAELGWNKPPAVVGCVMVWHGLALYGIRIRADS